MENDVSSFCCDEFPKRKKSKTELLRKQQKEGNTWKCLPAVILDEIFQYLSFNDVLKASSTCRNWRICLYHPRLWQKVIFIIEEDTLETAKFLRSQIGHKVQYATIRFNAMNGECLKEFLLLLDCFTTNNNLRGLILEPSHCHIPLPNSCLRLYNIEPFFKIILRICDSRPLKEFSVGGIEELEQFIPAILGMLANKRPNDVTKLGLATVKDDPLNYVLHPYTTPNIFLPFQSLQILSIDFDHLYDGLLSALENLNDLQRLVIHLHGMMDDHPGTSEDAWKSFVARQPNCLLRLTLIHAFDEVHRLQDILKNNMPLSHLKVLFCEEMNTNALEKLVKYRNTFVSLVWIDSLKNSDDPFCLVDNSQTGPRNLILLSWLCPKLEEIVVIGYKYFEENWIGIAKLRSETLKHFEIAADDVIRSESNNINFKRNIPKILGQSCSLLDAHDLHPVLLDPHSGDSDEYIMPILLSDLH